LTSIGDSMNEENEITAEDIRELKRALKEYKQGKAIPLDKV